jgi:hypothetical protein
LLERKRYLREQEETVSVHIEPTVSWRQRSLTSGAGHYVKSGITSWGLRGRRDFPGRQSDNEPEHRYQNFGPGCVKEEHILKITVTSTGHFATLSVPGVCSERTEDRWQDAKHPPGITLGYKAHILRQHMGT